MTGVRRATRSREEDHFGYHRPWTHSPHLNHSLVVIHDSALTILGHRIREKRKNLGWTQEYLADQAEIDRSYIGGVERGERNLTFTILCQICKALDCTVADLTSSIPERHV